MSRGGAVHQRMGRVEPSERTALAEAKSIPVREAIDDVSVNRAALGLSATRPSRSGRAHLRSPDNVRLCRSREQKVPPSPQLVVGFFVDDRIDVLAFTTAVVSHRFLFGGARRRSTG